MPPTHRRSVLPPALAAVVIAIAASARAQTSDQDHARHNVFAQPKWRELGPVTSGGRIVDIAVHPQRPQVFWVAAASGGIWKTENGGVRFTPQFQDAYSISIGDIAVAPSNGDVLWVGTGEANNQRSSYWGNGVHKSTDGGKTWHHMGLDGTDHIGRIVVHPTNPDVVWVAALGALYSANDARGLYRTTDGGLHWQRVQHLGPDVGFVDVALDPQNPDVVFAASYERRRRAWNIVEGGQGSRLWRSRDAGATWTQLAGGLPDGVLGRIGIDVFAGDGKTVYATVENLNPRGTKPAEPVLDPTTNDPRGGGAAPDAEHGGDGDANGADPDDPRIEPLTAELLADPVAWADRVRRVAQAQDPARRTRKAIVGGEIYRSDDGGSSWRKTHADDVEIGGSPGYYYGQIRVDPTRRETVYVLSVPVHKSTDGGKTWTPGRGRGAAAGAFAATLHVDHHALWIDPRDGDHCLLGNDGGLAVTWDGGASWDHLTHLPVLQYYTVATDNRSPYRVYGGLQDNGTWGFPIHGSTSSGLRPTDAYRIDGGDGFFVCVDPDDADVVYSESQFGGMSRQNLRTGERKSIKPRAPKGAQALRFNWQTPLVLSPNAPRTVYTGSQYVHRSRDRGDTWQTISPDLTSNDADKKKGNVPHCTITSIAETPGREGMLWAGTDDGRVWLTKDGGARWVELTDRFPAAVQGLWVSRVEASPHDASTAFVAFTGYREDLRAPFVFRTDDGGESWLSIAHDLPREPVNVVRQHPRNPRALLVGTEMGCYVSIDDGAHWFPLGGGLPRVAVHDLVVHGREPHVLVGTHGRGIWALDAALLETLRPEQLDTALVALRPSDGVLLRRAFSEGNTGARGWSVPNPFTTPTFRYLLAQDSDTKVTVEVLDAAGTVLWKKDGPQSAGYHEVPWAVERTGRGPFGQGGPGGAQGGAPGGAGAQGQGQGQGPGGRGQQNAQGPRAGTFAVRITRGEQVSTQTFRVVDRRGPAGVLGSWPAEEEEEQDAERAEGGAEAAAGTPGGRARR
jgi:photosystem II stability/assembly factor-like uncharacterized protein